MRNAVLRLVLVFGALSLASAMAVAQRWPQRSIKMIARADALVREARFFFQKSEEKCSLRSFFHFRHLTSQLLDAGLLDNGLVHIYFFDDARPGYGGALRPHQKADLKELRFHFRRGEDFERLRL